MTATNLFQIRLQNRLKRLGLTICWTVRGGQPSSHTGANEIGSSLNGYIKRGALTGRWKSLTARLRQCRPVSWPSLGWAWHFEQRNQRSYLQWISRGIAFLDRSACLGSGSQKMGWPGTSPWVRHHARTNVGSSTIGRAKEHPTKPPPSAAKLQSHCLGKLEPSNNDPTARSGNRDALADTGWLAQMSLAHALCWFVQRTHLHPNHPK